MNTGLDPFLLRRDAQALRREALAGLACALTIKWGPFVARIAGRVPDPVAPCLARARNLLPASPVMPNA